MLNQKVKYIFIERKIQIKFYTQIVNLFISYENNGGVKNRRSQEAPPLPSWYEFFKLKNLKIINHFWSSHLISLIETVFWLQIHTRSSINPRLIVLVLKIVCFGGKQKFYNVNCMLWNGRKSGGRWFRKDDSFICKNFNIA